MVRPPRHASQPGHTAAGAPDILGPALDELTANNSLVATPSDPGMAAMMAAMQAISVQMVALSSRVDRSKQRRHSPSGHRSATSTPIRREIRPLTSPPPRVPPPPLNT
ncbi:unnamed protein product [Gordionus sp. m RMFG-2023]